MRRLFTVLTVTTGVLTIPLTASARDCGDLATQSQMNACAADEYKEADADLNRAYSEVMGRLSDDPGARKMLQQAQRAWIAFRDAECAFSTSATLDGSVHPMLVSQCLTELTYARTEQLDAYLDCEEGDLSCPIPPE